ncbi:hypothetical protein [Parafilimonas sp.]|uniref:putative polyvalent protein kinase domain-containing protein n=1 Tax=Parafilimonas sp. TaxID=1969739 RepID=UPI0039E61415
MPDGKKSYKVGNDIYDIPEEKADSFLKKYPNAVQVQSYTVDKDTFDIPVQKVESFLKAYPSAKPLGFDSKEVQQQPALSSENAKMQDFLNKKYKPAEKVNYTGTGGKPMQIDTYGEPKETTTEQAASKQVPDAFKTAIQPKQKAVTDNNTSFQPAQTAKAMQAKETAFELDQKRELDKVQAIKNSTKLYFDKTGDISNIKDAVEAGKPKDISLKNFEQKPEEYSLEAFNRMPAVQKKQAELWNGIKDGKYSVYTDNAGNPKVQYNMDGWENFKAGLQHEGKVAAELDKLDDMDEQGKINYLNNLLKADNEYLPVRPDEMSNAYSLASTVPMMAKGAAGTLAGIGVGALTRSPQLGMWAGGTIAGIATVPGMGRDAKYASLIQHYKEAKEQEHTDEEAFTMADKASDADKYNAWLQGTALTAAGMLTGGEAMQAKSFLGKVGNFVKAQPKSIAEVSGLSAMGSLFTDAYKSHLGYDVGDPLQNAANAAYEQVLPTIAMNTAMGIGMGGGAAAGKWLKSQAKGYLANNLSTEALTKKVNAEVAAGALSSEQGQKALKDYADYKSAWDNIPDGFDNDTKASLAGLIQKKKDIQAAQAEKVAAADDNFKADVKESFQKQIDDIDSKIARIKDGEDWQKVDTDELTGDPVSEINNDILSKEEVKKLKDRKLELEEMLAGDAQSKLDTGEGTLNDRHEVLRELDDVNKKLAKATETGDTGNGRIAANEEGAAKESAGKDVPQPTEDEKIKARNKWLRNNPEKADELFEKANGDDEHFFGLVDDEIAKGGTSEAEQQRIDKQEKINSLLDRITAHNGKARNYKGRAQEVNEIKLAANELGLKYDDSYGKLFNESGNPVQKKSTVTNRTEAEFDTDAYSDKTHDTVSRLTDEPDLASGLTIVGEDGKNMSQQQKEAALNDIKEGKQTKGAKAIYDAMEGMVNDDMVHWRNPETGERQGIKFDDYFGDGDVKADVPEEEYEEAPFVKKASGKKGVTEQDKRTGESENKFGKEPLKDVYSEIANNGINKTVLQKIAAHAERIITGKSRYKRFSEREQEGLKRGGKHLTEAALIAGRSDNRYKEISGQKLEATPGHPEKVRVLRRELTSDELSERQEADVRKYAVKNKIWHANTEKYLESKYGHPFDSGKESKVWYDPDRGVVIKSFDTYQQFPTLEHALDAITLHNTEFPETTLKVIGYGKNEDGNFSIITEQRYIKKHPDGGVPTEAEINEFAAKRGYKPNPDRLGFDYTKDDTNLHDLHDGNVIKGEDGKLYAIDTTMALKNRKGSENEIEHNTGLQEQDKRGLAQQASSETTLKKFTNAAETVIKKLYPKAKVETYNTEAEYIKAGGSEGERGKAIMNKNGEHRLMLNLEAIKADKSPRTAIHEALHPIVYDKYGVATEKLNSVWNDLVKQTKGMDGMDAVWRHVALYDESKHAPEGITEFLTQVAQGNIDVSKLPSERRSAIIRTINKLLDALGIKIHIGNPNDLKKFAEDIKAAFETGDAEGLKGHVENKGLDKYFKEQDKVGEADVFDDNELLRDSKGKVIGIKPEAAEAIQKEHEQIISDAKANGTYMKAPNGKPTRLNERQWATVRTKRFKKWFGDWELMQKETTVHKADKPKAQGLKEHANEIADNVDKAGNVVKNDDTGKSVYISRGAIRKSLSESANKTPKLLPIEIAAVAKIRELMKTAILAESYPDTKNVKEIQSMHRLYSAIEYEGKTYRVKLTVKEYKENQKGEKGKDLGKDLYYTSEVSAVEVLGSYPVEAGGTGDGSRTNSRTQQPSTISATNLLQNAVKNNGEKFNTDYSKVVDENGEPLAVYHGTDANFNEFDKNAGRKWAGKVGFWFTDKPDIAETFGNSIMPSFVSIKNPKEISLEQFNKWRDNYHNNPEFWQNKRDEWIKDGHDGLIVKGREETLAGRTMPANDLQAAFEPEQIKSATANKGTYSKKTGIVDYDLRPEDRELRDFIDDVKKVLPGVTAKEIKEVLPDEYQHLTEKEIERILRSNARNESTFNKWVNYAKGRFISSQGKLSKEDFAKSFAERFKMDETDPAIEEIYNEGLKAYEAEGTRDLNQLVSNPVADEESGIKGKKYVGILPAVKDYFTGNLNQLGQLSPEAKQAAVKFASSASQASMVIRKAVNAIAGKYGAKTWIELRQAVVQSRLDGIRKRWQELAAAVDNTSDINLIEGVKGNVGELLDNIEARSPLENLRQDATALINNNDFDQLKQLLKESFEYAADHVANVDFSKGRSYDEIVNDSNFKDALDLYKSLIEKPVRDNHASNEGIFSDALGELDTYFPLIPMDVKGNLLSPSSPQLKKPINLANKFATGLSNAYDISVSKLNEQLTKAFKNNNKAAMVKALEDAGLIKTLNPFDTGANHLSINGEVYKARIISIGENTIKITDGKKTVVPPQKVIIPDWLHKELKPLLENTANDKTMFGKVMDWITSFALGGIFEPAIHTANLVGGVVNGTPFPGTSLASKTIGNIPVTKVFTSIFNIINEDVTSPKAVEHIQDMANVGLISNRTRHVTWNAETAEATGAKKVLPVNLSPFLYGRKGIDLKARVLMDRIALKVNPKATPEERRRFVNQLGNYVFNLEGQLGRTVKANGISPFFTAASTFLKNGVKGWLGITPLPTKSLSLKDKMIYRSAQLFSAGAVGLTATWAVAYKANTGNYPWDDKESRFLMIPLNDDELNYIDKHPFLQKIFYKNGKPQDVNMGFFNRTLDRGARGLGLSAAYNTIQSDGNAGQVAEAMYKDQLNSFLSPLITSPSIHAISTIATGHTPYIIGLRDYMTGEPAIEFARDVKTMDNGFKQMGANFAQGVIDVNPLVGMIADETGFDFKPKWSSEDEDSFNYMRMIMNLTMPNIVKPHIDNDRQAYKLMQQQMKIEQAAAKEK